MRRSLIALSAFIAGVVFAVMAPDHAGAGPRPALAPLQAEPGMVEKAGYLRRQYRRQLRRDGYFPEDAPYGPAVVGDEVVLVPLRPSSCGQYRYWNGVRCADARYETPYIGPRY
jgi:hypothetical protein